jgi:hypothetical protein
VLIIGITLSVYDAVYYSLFDTVHIAQWDIIRHKVNNVSMGINLFRLIMGIYSVKGNIFAV